MKSSHDHKVWYLTTSQNNCRFMLKPHLTLAAFFVPQCTFIYTQHTKSTPTDLSRCSTRCHKISYLSMSRYNILPPPPPLYDHINSCSTKNQRMKTSTYPVSHPWIKSGTQKMRFQPALNNTFCLESPPLTRW